MTNWAVTTDKLSKTYGSHQVLRDINLRVPQGAIYGFVGANGAGKTTTIRILLGLVAASSGTASVLGVARGTLPPSPISGVSYLPDVPDISPWLGAQDALISFGCLAGMPADRARDRSVTLLDFVGLHGVPGKVGTFSRGMKQRLGIAAALITSPRLLILDEPTSALDPLGRADVLAIIRDLAGHATVMFSSHILSDVEKIATHIGLLHRGKLLAQGPLEELLERDSAGSAYLHIATHPDKVAQLIQAISSVDPEATLDQRTRGLDVLFQQLTSGTEAHQ